MDQSNIYQLPSEISEEDRTFFLVLDIAFSQHHLNADFGYYYEAECEDTFSFGRFQTASEYFHFYRCHQALKPLQRAFVQYVNITSLASLMSTTDFQQIQSLLIREFNLICNYNQVGLVDVFFICCRVPNIFYVFMERPDETLEEYLIRHSKNTLQYYSCYSKSFGPVRQIPIQNASFITKSVATTLLELHKKAIFHGRLSTNSIFIKNKEIIKAKTIKIKNGSNKNDDVGISVKLANLAFAEMFDQDTNNRNQILLQDILRTRDLINLYDIVIRIIECTEFISLQERERFLELASILIMPISESESSSIETTNLDSTTNQIITSLPESRLETFVESLWMDS